MAAEKPGGGICAALRGIEGESPYRRLPLVQHSNCFAVVPTRKNRSESRVSDVADQIGQQRSAEPSDKRWRMASDEQTSQKHVPASFFGMPLGMVALGLAWRSAAAIWPVPTLIAEILIWSGSALWAFLFIIYLGKWLLRRADAEEELQHPIQCCFVGLAGVVGLLVSIGLSTEFRTLSVGVFCLGFAWTLAFAIYRTGKTLDGRQKP